ncbi:MAG: hypothetical protein JSR99_16965 [Proteobacteria bacterium]|nr:hypothetical protein [Pseudomonadota bacterium]
MSVFSFVRRSENRLDVVAGLIDGILNALALTSGRLVQVDGGGVSLGLAIRVSIAAGLTTIFVFFVAHYAELRIQLIRHERELNMTEHGRLAASRLGRQILRESALKALLATCFSFAGALFPLLVCVALPSFPWISLAISIATLAALGALLAKTFYGSPLTWSLALGLGGIALTIIGIKLNLVAS